METLPNKLAPLLPNPRRHSFSSITASSPPPQSAAPYTLRATETAARGVGGGWTQQRLWQAASAERRGRRRRLDAAASLTVSARQAVGAPGRGSRGGMEHSPEQKRRLDVSLSATSWLASSVSPAPRHRLTPWCASFSGKTQGSEAESYNEALEQFEKVATNLSKAAREVARKLKTEKKLQ